MRKIKRLIKGYMMQMKLDKLSNKNTQNRREFLNFHISLKNDGFKDYLYLSKNSTFTRILDLLEKKIKVVCNLHDKNGKFGMEIVKIENNFEDETCIITMKHEETHKLQDKFLYNLIYNNSKNEYSLEEQDEYFEKLEVEK